MLIFDNFPDPVKADAFAVRIRDCFHLKTIVCESQEQSNRYDLFPFKLVPPIVLVERPPLVLEEGEAVESEIRVLVSEFYGKFAGT